MISKTIKENRNLKNLRPSLGKKQIYSLINENGSDITNREKILRTVEEFYGKLYQSKVRRSNTHKINKIIKNMGSKELPDIVEEEIKKALRDMKRDKASGEDDITSDMIIEGGENLVKIVTILLNECLQQAKIPETWKNAKVILLHKKGERRLENYCPITLLSHLFKLLTKIITD